VRLGKTVLGRTPLAVFLPQDSPGPELSFRLHGYRDKVIPLPNEGRDSDFVVPLEPERPAAGEQERSEPGPQKEQKGHKKVKQPADTVPYEKL
jgi:hypothetical protein